MLSGMVCGQPKTKNTTVLQNKTRTKLIFSLPQHFYTCSYHLNVLVNILNF